MIKPDWRYRSSSLTLLVFGTALIAAGAAPVIVPAMLLENLGWMRIVGIVVGALIGLIFAFLGLIMLVAGVGSLFDLRRWEFDPGGDTLRYGFLGRRCRSLDDVIAVQLVRHGEALPAPQQLEDSVYCEEEESERPAVNFTSYQLDLVLDDPKKPRMVLSDCGDLDWTWRAATRLSETLNVALVDCVADSTTARVIDRPGGPRAAKLARVLPRRGPHVATTPLRAPAAEGRAVRLVQRGPDVLAVKPTGTMRLVGAFYVGLSLVGFAVLAGSFRQVAQTLGAGAILIGLVPVAFLAVGLWILSRRMAFDRRAGLLSYGSLWSRKTRPLADIAAVQFISGGRHMPASDDFPPFETYQANLVLSDPPGERINVVNQGDRASAEQTARRLAEFLNVPLLDELTKNQKEKKRE